MSGYHSLKYSDYLDIERATSTACVAPVIHKVITEFVLLSCDHYEQVQTCDSLNWVAPLS